MLNSRINIGTILTVSAIIIVMTQKSSVPPIISFLTHKHADADLPGTITIINIIIETRKKCL